MIPLHALALTLMGRFTNRLYVGYSSWYAIGTLASMQVPFVGFQPVRTSEHMGALGMLEAFLEVSFSSIAAPPRCLWPFADHCICRARSVPCVIEAVPTAVGGVRGRSRRPRYICHHWSDIQRVDCTVDRPFLFLVGYWLCKKVGDFVRAEACP
jgi:Oligosaccharyl transferase STT3 subunit